MTMRARYLPTLLTEPMKASQWNNGLCKLYSQAVVNKAEAYKWHNEAQALDYSSTSLLRIVPPRGSETEARPCADRRQWEVSEFENWRLHASRKEAKRQGLSWRAAGKSPRAGQGEPAGAEASACYYVADFVYEREMAKDNVRSGAPWVSWQTVVEDCKGNAYAALEASSSGS